jgi:hypothetical protein
MYDRIQVVLKSLVTWLTLLSTVLVIAATEIADLTDDAIPHDVGMWLIRAAAWLTTAVAIIRRVSPVVESQRGLLPKA